MHKFLGGLAAAALAVLGVGTVAWAANNTDVWVDNVGQPAGAGHEMDPHLACQDINLWGTRLANSSGTYTIDGWAPTGRQEVDYSGSWSYSKAAGGNQVIAVIPVNTLISNAVANGDTATGSFHFKLQLVQSPQKHKTFWVDCAAPSSTSTTPPPPPPTTTPPTTTPPTTTTSTPPKKPTTPGGSLKAICTISTSTVHLTGASGKKTKTFTVSVGSFAVRQVRFYVDGQLVATVKKSHNGKFSTQIDPSKYGFGGHHVTAKIAFSAPNCHGVQRHATFVHPHAAVVSPKFTG